MSILPEERDNTRMLRLVPLNVTYLDGNFGFSPFAAESRRRIKSLCKRYFIPFQEVAITYLCAFLFPYLPEEEFYVCSNIISIMVIFYDYVDDIRKSFDDRRLYVDDILTTIESNVVQTPGKGVAALLTEILAEVKNQTLRKYIVKNIKEFLESARAKTIGAAENLHPNDYLEFRLSNTGCETCFGLMLLDKIEIEPYIDFLKSDMGKEAARFAGTNVALSNDLTSLRCDKKMGSHFNMIFSVMKHLELNEDESILHCTDLAKKAFQQLYQLKPGGFGEEVVQRMKLFCRGSNIWGITTSKYF